MTKDYTMTEFLNRPDIRDEVAQRWQEVGERATGRKRWEILDSEYPNMNLPAIRMLAQRHINGPDDKRDKSTEICHGFQLRLGHLSAKRLAEQKYSRYTNGHESDESQEFDAQIEGMGPLEFAFSLLAPNTLKVGDVFGLPAALLCRPLGCMPKSIIDPFRRRDGKIWEAGWRFEFLNSDYLDYHIKVVAKPNSDNEKQKRAEAAAERAKQVEALRGEVGAATQILTELLQKLEQLQ